MSKSNFTRNQLPLIVAATAVLVAVGIVAAIAINNAGNSTPTGVVTPPPSSLATATVTPAPATQIPFADCTAAKFGAPLQPLNEPADPHVYTAPPPMTIDTTKLYEATITTAKGTIVLCLQPDLAPNTVNNFVTLARNHFYDGLKFQRVVSNFVIQGGDPKGDGTGGPGYHFNDEPVREKYVAGCVAMANGGANTNGSQFFICTVDDTAQLQPAYNLFGKVASGLDVANKIQQGDVMETVTVTEQQ